MRGVGLEVGRVYMAREADRPLLDLYFADA